MPLINKVTCHLDEDTLLFNSGCYPRPNMTFFLELDPILIHNVYIFYLFLF